MIERRHDALIGTTNMKDSAHILPYILRLPDVLRAVGMSRPSLYRQIRAGVFPQQVQLSPGSVGWLREEVEQWLLCRAAARQLPRAA
jgi:prophage regulatory protein